MTRHIGWYSDGIASAIACKYLLREEPEALIVKCDTGSEDEDNARFRAECARWFNREILILKNPEFEDNYAVWTKRRYMSGIAGAPCTMEQKVTPRLAFQQPGDVHVFGYTWDKLDVARFEAFQKNYPDLIARAPLIEREITKANCLAMMQDTGIEPPRTYAMGFPNANCLQTGCVKATSPDYWALFRKVFPDRFAKTAALARELNVRLVIMDRETLPDGRVHNIRGFIDDIPADWPTLNPVAPACDFLCHINGQDLAA
ncbi:hypothetical protein [Phenylobacterium sp. J367]|uniref:hypothetical protein n=1 Tax=Phenylobacterium sp. J367 TaxID=2898435 RepID=UPI002151A32D|nr:hypothetical protein [Phenylobacterium sp. J367]MCR5876967.1 hypothetical protein [Phenylobacterium sp. J367]MCR5877035.1 hypothetical protein [Phenylobacterium sp. J367]